MARRSDHSRDQIREMALEAAQDIVRAEGFAKLSARKIAAAIGYTVGTLYLVFENLDDLVLQVNARTLDELCAHMAEAGRACPAGAECVLAMARAYVQFAAAHPHRWSMIYDHRLPPDAPVPGWYQERVARTFALLEDALTPLAAQHGRAAIEQAARTLWASVHGICMLAMTGKLDLVGGAAVQDLTDSLIRNYLKGLTAP